jgi:uncharacterized protein (TIRG00374 family)
MDSVRWSSHARRVSIGVAVVLAAVLLFYSLRGIEWRTAWRIIAGASPAWLALSAAQSTLALTLRALRWRILLNAEGTVGVADAFRATAAGYFGNNFLPARAGELVRSLMISSRNRLDTAYVLTTALAERVVDAIALVSIAGVVLLTLPSPPGWMGRASRPLALAAVLGATAITVAPLLEALMRRIIAAAPLPHAVKTPLLNVLEQVIRGLRSFHDARRASGFAALTAVIWCLDSLGMIVVARAIGLSMPLPAAFLLTAALGLSSALPSTPGYVGIFQFVAVTVLAPFGLTRTEAVAFIILAQVIGYVVIGLWGGLAIGSRDRRPAT